MKNDIGQRLREERERLGLSQVAMSDIGGVKKLTQLRYEKGDSFPDAAYLAALSRRHSACSFVGEALTYHLLKVDMLGPRLNRNVFRGLSTSGLRVFLRPSAERHPRVIYRFFVTPAILPVNSEVKANSSDCFPCVKLAAHATGYLPKSERRRRVLM